MKRNKESIMLFNYIYGFSLEDEKILLLKLLNNKNNYIYDIPHCIAEKGKTLEKTLENMFIKDIGYSIESIRFLACSEYRYYCLERKKTPLFTGIYYRVNLSQKYSLKKEKNNRHLAKLKKIKWFKPVKQLTLIDYNYQWIKFCKKSNHFQLIWVSMWDIVSNKIKIASVSYPIIMEEIKNYELYKNK